MNLFAGLDTFLGLFAATGLLGPQLLDFWLEQGADPDPNGQPPPPPEASAGGQAPQPTAADSTPLS